MWACVSIGREQRAESGVQCAVYSGGLVVVRACAWICVDVWLWVGVGAWQRGRVGVHVRVGGWVNGWMGGWVGGWVGGGMEG